MIDSHGGPPKAATRARRVRRRRDGGSRGSSWLRSRFAGEIRPPRTDWDAPPAVTPSSPSSSNGTTSPEAPPEASKDIELATKAVMKATGYEKAEARERITKAFRMLSNLGRKATWDEIVTTAIYGRVMDFGSKVVRRCGLCLPPPAPPRGRLPNAPAKAPETTEKPKTDDSK